MERASTKETKKAEEFLKKIMKPPFGELFPTTEQYGLPTPKEDKHERLEQYFKCSD